jgi:hypothetical protein
VKTYCLQGWRKALPIWPDNTPFLAAPVNSLNLLHCRKQFHFLWWLGEMTMLGLLENIVQAELTSVAASLFDAVIDLGDETRCKASVTM